MEGRAVERTRTEEWKSGCYLVRMRSLGSILPTDIIISDTCGDMTVWWAKHEVWVVATEATDHHMIEIAIS